MCYSLRFWLTNMLCLVWFPGNCVEVPEDGICLFSAISVALGSHATNHAFVWAAICNPFPSVGSQSHFLEAHVPSGPTDRAITCPNANSFVEVSGMCADGIFGTCDDVFFHYWTFSLNWCHGLSLYDLFGVCLRISRWPKHFEYSFDFCLSQYFTKGYRRDFKFCRKASFEKFWSGKTKQDLASTFQNIDAASVI